MVFIAQGRGRANRGRGRGVGEVSFQSKPAPAHPRTGHAPSSGPDRSAAVSSDEHKTKVAECQLLVIYFSKLCVNFRSNGSKSNGRQRTGRR